MSEFPQLVLKNTESNETLKNYITQKFSPEFVKSYSFETFLTEILRLLTVIKNNSKNKMDKGENFETKIIDAILSDCQNNNNFQKQNVLLGNLRAFAGENYNSQDFLGLK